MTLKELELKVSEAFEENYRTITGEGDSHFHVERAKHPGKVKATTITEEKRLKNRYGYHPTWTYVDAHHHIHVYRNTLPLVCDGIVNLTSKKLREISVFKRFGNHEFFNKNDRSLKLTVYKAAWIKQGRGTHISVEHGFIAEMKSTYFHAESLEKAVQGVWRKYKLDQFLAKEQAQRKNWVKKRFKSYIDSIPENLMLSYADSIASGNCSAGTDNFIYRNNLDPNNVYPARLIYKLAARKGTEDNVRRIIAWKMRGMPARPRNNTVRRSFLRRLLDKWFN